MKRRMRFPEVTVPIGLYCTYRYKRLSEESSFRAIDRGLRTGRARVVLWDGFAAWDLQRGTCSRDLQRGLAAGTCRVEGRITPSPSIRRLMANGFRTCARRIPESPRKSPQHQRETEMPKSMKVKVFMDRSASA